MKKIFFMAALLCIAEQSHCWGFYVHRKINFFAVFLLPPEMMLLYKPQIEFLYEHAVDPDKRRYVSAEEAPRHYIDIDHYGKYPFDSFPRKWTDAVLKFGEDSLQRYGIVPWYLQTMLGRLTNAFKEKDQIKILKYSADIGHYIADAHVPLHANSNHNGQLTDQKGIHGLWESRIPELLEETDWDMLIGKAEYISDPSAFVWKRVLESAAAADTVLAYEKLLSKKFPSDQKFSFEEKNGIYIRQYSSAYSKAYDAMLKGMIERRMRQSIYAVASFWYTAWVNAGQPDLRTLVHREFSPEELKDLERLNSFWKNNTIKGREE